MELAYGVADELKKNNLNIAFKWNRGPFEIHTSEAFTHVLQEAYSCE